MAAELDSLNVVARLLYAVPIWGWTCIDLTLSLHTQDYLNS